MDRRIGIGVMALAAVAGMAVVGALGREHGWASMPPLVPVFLLLMAAAPFLSWFRQDVAAWAVALCLLGGVALFGLSHGFLIWSTLGTLLGLALATLPCRQHQVPA